MTGPRICLKRPPTPSGGVAQLVRALPCHGRGYGFEPRHSRHFSRRFLRLSAPNGPLKHSETVLHLRCSRARRSFGTPWRPSFPRWLLSSSLRLSESPSEAANRFHAPKKMANQSQGHCKTIRSRIGPALVKRTDHRTHRSAHRGAARKRGNCAGETVGLQKRYIQQEWGLGWDQVWANGIQARSAGVLVGADRLLNLLGFGFPQTVHEDRLAATRSLQANIGEEHPVFDAN